MNPVAIATGLAESSQAVVEALDTLVERLMRAGHEHVLERDHASAAAFQVKAGSWAAVHEEAKKFASDMATWKQRLEDFHLAKRREATNAMLREDAKRLFPDGVIPDWWPVPESGEERPGPEGEPPKPDAPAQCR